MMLPVEKKQMPATNSSSPRMILGISVSFFQQNGQNRRKGNDHKTVQRIQITLNGGTGFAHGILQLQRQQNTHQI